MRRLKEKWRATLEDDLYFPEFNAGTAPDNPLWIRENVGGFSTIENANDYISKTVIIEKERYVQERNN